MTLDIILAFLGHLVGDYLFQTKKMALGKSQKGSGGVWLCTLHVFIYTNFICIFLANFSLLFFALVFIPHWIIDRFSLASLWLKIIKGRTFEDAFESKDKYRDFDIAFTSIVYTVTDNTFHLLCLVGALYLI